MVEEKIDKDSESPELIKDDKQLAMLCHVLGLITGVCAPLVYCLATEGDSEFLLHHEKEALNFQITMILIWGITIGLDVFVFDALFIIPVALMIDLVYVASAVSKAKDGVFYKYPISIPFIKTLQKSK